MNRFLEQVIAAQSHGGNGANGSHAGPAMGRAMVDQGPNAANQQQAFADELQRVLVELAGQHGRKPWQVRATLECLISSGSWPYR